MKKKYVVGIIVGVVALGGIFVGTFAIRSAQLEKEISGMTDEYLEEVDDMAIEELEVTYEEQTYTKIEDLKDIPAGTSVDCKVKLANGETVEADGYITKGDDNHAEYNGGVVKITVKE